MATKRDIEARSLQLPPNAAKPNAIEVLRVWAVPREQQQLTLRTTWQDPAVWGLLLADLARHAAKAYAQQDGADEAAALARIKQVLSEQLLNPTVS